MQYIGRVKRHKRLGKRGENLKKKKRGTILIVCPKNIFYCSYFLIKKRKEKKNFEDPTNRMTNVKKSRNYDATSFDFHWPALFFNILVTLSD